MPALSNDDVIAMTFLGRCFGQRIMLTRYLHITGDVAGTDIIGQLGEFNDAVYAHPMYDAYLACLPPDYEMEMIRAQEVWPTRSVRVEKQLTGQVGTFATGATSANRAGVITFRSEYGERWGYCNVHIGPIPDAASDDGLLTGAYQLLLDDLAEDMDDTPFFVPEWPDAVLNFVLPPRSQSTPIRLRDHTVQTTTRVMRRRTVGVGE